MDGLVAAFGGVLLGMGAGMGFSSVLPLTGSGAPHPLVIAVSVIAAAAFAAVIYVCQPVTRFKLRDIPGPWAPPLFGHLPQILKIGSMKFYMTLKEQYGPVFTVWYGRRPFIVVTEPTVARYVGTKLLNHPNFINTSIMRGQEKEIDAAGLVAARDNYWRTVRTTWQPAFSPAALSGPAPTASSPGMHRSACYGGKAPGADCSLSISPRPAPSASAPGQRLVNACKTFFRSASIHTGSKWSRISMLLPELSPIWARLSHAYPDKPLLDQWDARKAILETSKALIEGWRQHAEGGANGADAGTAPAKPVMGGGSFLAQLLKGSSSSKLTDVQLAAQANTFTLAGYETTANALAFTMFFLGLHPDAEAKLVAEVDALADRLTSEGKPGLRAATMEDLVHLPYTEACFQEAMRLFPPAHLTTREVGAEPFNLPVNLGEGKGMKTYSIPPNTVIVLSINTIHHDPALWPEPEAYKPERFLEKQEGLNINHVPFGYGSRMCIGYRFALAEAKLALARLYHDFNFRLLPGQAPMQVSVGITQAPKYGVNMAVTPRQRPLAASS
ncbi:cytochrome P450 [Dunaliella salina]|uniref:Cytochrome P450 n=1 Tax=Dunaliella salina TaxID=3046 RepID=A0ABQ7GNC3_DUNSA|nr:cytochrome P450 [Dunaliella salina]|eukprot:KAF5836109.1 cytochrome P450 [Dunaliella salina]